MAVPASPNAASFSDIQSTFGGSNPISLSEYYTGGGLTRTGTGVHTPNGIPTSGAISVNDFRGANNYFESWSTTITEADAFLFTSSRGYQEAYTFIETPVAQQGSMGDTTPNQGAMNGSYTIITSTAVSASGGKGSPAIYSYQLSLRGPAGLSNDDLSAFKTFTVNGRLSLSRSNASFNFTAPNSYGWNWASQPASIYTTSAGTRAFTLTNA